MRRSNKPSLSGYSAAAPPGHSRPSSHLDISSSHDDEPSNKIHKSNRRNNKSKIVITALCGLISLGTLIYVAKLVSNDGAKGLLQLGKGSKIAAVHNIKHKIMKHHHHDAKSSASTNHRHALPQQNLLPPDSIYRSTVTDIHGSPQNLIQYAGSISLIVNVACEWGLTSSNYKQLATLYDKYKSRGFTVLAFPSNDYHQEKETDKEILDYVQSSFPQVNFPLFSKAPLKSNVVFQMCERHTGEAPGWNFHKYLVNGEGKAVKSFGHRVSPLEMEEDIVRLLEENEESAVRQQVPQTF